jgi:hypothetical protein
LPVIVPGSKSPEVQPLVDVVPLGSGGITMPPAGWISAFAVPLLVAAFHSSTSLKSCAVGLVSLKVGVPTNELYVNVYG